MGGDMGGDSEARGTVLVWILWFRKKRTAIIQESQEGAYWKIGVPIIHSLTKNHPLCDHWFKVGFVLVA